MIPARFRWEWKQPDGELAAAWAARFGVPSLVARVLAARGYTETEAAALLQPARAEDLLDPLQLKGMSGAVGRIRQALAAGEHIRVYGDYDADGVTSTALMTRLLSSLNARFDIYIPHRGSEGYGLNIPAIEQAAAEGVSLIVTVDNGISAVEPIAHAKRLGIDVVVTDHHEPPAQLPGDAVAIVNPKQPGCPYPNKGLCGAGVAFKLAHALLGRPPLEWADLAAIGTIADLMPLLGENRLIARLGLAQMRSQPSVGIRALATVSGIQPETLTSGRVGFSLAPRLNAGGRLERADGAVRLLTTSDAGEAEMLARELDRLNLERQRLVEQTVEEAECMWADKLLAWPTGEADAYAKAGGGPNVIVLSHPGWHAGIAGLVASKLVERHHRPAIILAEDPASGTAKGSARSIDGFDLYAALTDCAEYMVHYGGHQAAAGLTIPIGCIGMLEQAMHRIAAERLRPEDWQPKKTADLICTLDEITLAAAEALGALEPFGQGNPTPRLILEGLQVRQCRPLGKDGQHVRLIVGQGGQTLEAVGFGLGSLSEQLAPGRKLDLLGELTLNEWNGHLRIQFSIKDLRCMEPRWIDRRNANPGEIRQAIVSLAADQPSGLVVICASIRMASELASEEALQGAIIRSYSDQQGDAKLQPALVESAATIARMRHDSSPVRDLRTLVLVGLPSREEDIRQLAHWIREGAVWSTICLFADAASCDERPLLLQRGDFARVYALFREAGTWIDAPDGLARRISARAGLPLSAVRLIQEVFEELGFIRVHGAQRTLVPDAPRKNLAESARYQRMLRQAKAASFPDWPVDRLKSWVHQILSGQPSGKSV
jgi:single-stranded-DNA-specific exonuclease